MRREETAAGLRNYNRLRLDVTPQQNSAEREYTFTDPKMGPLHALDQPGHRVLAAPDLSDRGRIQPM